MATFIGRTGNSAHPACDLCYARKIKCDRNDPCGNCLDANTQCLRTRPKRVGRPRQSSTNQKYDTRPEKTESMINRLVRLEDSVTRLTTVLSKSPIQQRDSASPSPQPEDLSGPRDRSQLRRGSSESRSEERGGRASKRMRVESPEDRTKEERQDSAEIETRKCQLEQDLARATTLEAQKFIQGELAEASQSFPSEKKAVLETALRFINQMSHGVHSEATPSTKSCSADIPDIISPPSPEFVHLMLAESRYSYPANWYLEFSSFISAKTLERMTVALVDAKEDEATLIQYSICVNSYAYAFLTRLNGEEMHEPMTEVLDRSRDIYLRKALIGLNYISILAKPSLPLLQALLSGVVLLQRLGDTPKCWTLNTVACRVCVALGLHHPQPLSTPYSEQTQEEKEARACFLWTFIFDKGSAMSLHRPVVLPVWDVPVEIAAPSDRDKPFTAILAALYQFAAVQATIMCELHFQPAQTNSPQRQEHTVSALKKRMAQIKKQITELRAFPPHSTDASMISEWTSLDFIYHSIMTVIIRSDSSIVSDAIKREECLENARAAFIALQNLRQHLKSAMDEKCFAMFLPWTVLYYPLRPYYVLFCNVVATSHVADYEIMRDFAESLTELPALNDSAIRLQKLCATLVGLCTPLIQRAKAAAAAANQTPEPGAEGGPSALGEAGEEGGVGSGGGGGTSYGASGSGAGQGARGDPRASRPRSVGVGGSGGGSGQERPQPFYPNSVMGGSTVAMMTPELSQPPWYQTSMYPESGGVGASGSRATATATGSGSAAVEGAAGAAGSAGAEGPQTGSSEEMFNALFDVQPSLDWLGADVFSNSQGSGNGNNGASGSTGSGAAGNAVVPGWIDWDVMGGGSQGRGGWGL
ncbi:uncharacterized protein J3D65DRAFT_47895 [Phyllosticta citribraziliensis]|uniref:Zn(2)-C6 fungal-type domain-containing protein n=1 Tax=Phyllosticta citribraziliensis TaxID=989973 RepID=A0ABR1MB20_9PEZI